MSTPADPAPRAVTNTFLDGPSAAAPSMDVLRERYRVITTAMKKVEAYDHPDLIDKAIVKYHEIRESHASATFGEEDLPGWRIMILQRAAENIEYAGVKQDGTLYQGLAMPDEGEGFKGLRAIEVAQKLSELADRPGFPNNRTDVQDEVAFSVQSTEWLPLSPYSRLTNNIVLDEADLQARTIMQVLDGDDESDVGIDMPMGAQVPPPAQDYAAQHASRLLRNHLHASFKRVSGRRFGAMSANCMRALDKETSSILAGAATYTASAANWLNGMTWKEDGSVIVDPTVARNRHQAARAYPVLFQEFSTRGDEVGDAIDAGEELSRPLCKQFNTKPVVLRRLAGLTWQKAGRAALVFPHKFVGTLGSIDVNHIPTNRRGFAEMATAIDAALTVAPAVDGNADEMIKSIGGRFDRIAAMVEGNPARGVSDLAREIEKRVLRPAVAQRARAQGFSEEQAMRIAQKVGPNQVLFSMEKRRGKSVLEGHNLRTALTASQRWHRAIPRINEELGDGGQFGDAGSNRWAPLAGDIEIGKDLVASEITSVRELREEGLRQGHCVGGYGPNVKSGESVIFSIRQGEEIVSTIELGFAKDARGKDTFEVRQNYGRDNSAPSPIGKRAEKTLLKALRKLPEAQVSEYRARMNASREETKAQSLHEEAGYDIFNEGKLAQAFDVFREYLPKKAARMSLEDWVSKVMDDPQDAKGRNRDARVHA